MTDSGAERAALAELKEQDARFDPLFVPDEVRIPTLQRFRAAIIREETGTSQRCPTCDSDNPAKRTGYFKYRSCFDPWHFDPRHNQPLPAAPDEGGKR